MITYIEYQYGISKGGINAGDRISSPFGFDTPDTDYAAKSEYTGARVVEDVTLEANKTTVDVTPLWGSKTVDARSDNPKRQAETNSVLIEVVKVGDKVYKVGETADDTHFTVAPKVGAEGTFTITFASAPVTADTAAKYGYVYDNIVIPQDKIPSVRAEMKSVALVARARRIAVYYSQIAAYQA